MTPAAPRPGLREVSPYESPQMQVAARLNTNECPYPLPESFRNDLADAVRELSLNRYPDREATQLRHRLADHAGHPVEGTWVANGSNEVIQQLLLAYGGPGRRVVLFDPTYLLHERIAWITNSELVRVRLDAPFAVTSGDVAAAAYERPDVVFVCSPNNPTGNAQPPATIEELATVTTALIVVDEAYIEFGGKSALSLVLRHPNVAVVRTLSKAFALAGARIGYCLAAPEVVEDLRRVSLPYHIGAITQAAGLVALAHAGDAAAILDAVRTQRDRIAKALAAMPGVEAFRSDANFVLFRPPGDARHVCRALLHRGVLVRDLTEVVPNCLRVTAGTADEVDLFLSALEEALA